MNLNQIILHPQMLADLYASTLVEHEPSWKPAGGSNSRMDHNQKQILIIIADTGEEVIPEPEQILLKSILSACRLNPEDITTLHFKTGTDQEYDRLHLHARIVLMFGVAPLSIGLPINFPQFQVQQFSNHSYLYAPSLAEIAMDKKTKTNLWNALKNLFSI